MSPYKKDVVTQIVLSVAKTYPASAPAENWQFLQDLNLSPLNLLEICIKLEQEFKIKMDDEKYFNLQTMADLYTLVSTLCEAKKPSR
jgi:acyl carrier protein